jgi:hypothetical protein
VSVDSSKSVLFLACKFDTFIQRTRPLISGIPAGENVSTIEVCHQVCSENKQCDGFGWTDLPISNPCYFDMQHGDEISEENVQELSLTYYTKECASMCLL